MGLRSLAFRNREFSLSQGSRRMWLREGDLKIDGEVGSATTLQLEVQFASSLWTLKKAREAADIGRLLTENARYASLDLQLDRLKVSEKLNEELTQNIPLLGRAEYYQVKERKNE